MVALGEHQQDKEGERKLVDENKYLSC